MEQNCGCTGNCASCGGKTCGSKTLSLTQPEIQMLTALGEIPFLPVARRADSDVPVFLEQSEIPAELCSAALQCLEKKNLICIDYEKPLSGACMDAYAGYPVHGSIALTARGQTVLELLETQGVQ